MDFQAALGLDDPAEPDNTDEALELIREEYGTGAVGFLVDLGIPRRTAQYYYAGRSVRDPERRTALVSYARGVAEERADAQRQRVADRVRAASGTNVGKVDVKSTSSGDDEGSRTPGWTVFYPGELDQVADLIAGGEFKDAAEVYSEAVMESYGAGGALDIDDYKQHIQWR